MLLKKGLLISEENVTNLEYIQRQIVMTFSLLTFVLLLLLGISDFFLGMSPVIVWIKIGLAFPFLAAYFLISKYGKAQVALNILLFLAHAVIGFNFLYNDGSNGPTIYAFFLVLVISALLIRGWAKVAWFIGSFVMFFLLFYGEAQGFLIVEHYYEGAESQFTDHAVTILWISLFVFTVLHFFIRSYQNQNKVLNEIKQRQEQTLEEVKTLNDQKNRLIAILSHDLKNPIGMLHMTLGMVDKGFFEPGEMEQILGNLKNQSFHLNKVLNNTLSWVMTELEDRPNEVHETSVEELTEEIKDMMMVQAMEKNQTIDVSVSGTDITLPLESNEIKIILKNLLDNAIKFAPLNSTVTLNLAIDSDKISWKVSNEGAVISLADQKELFLFRARTSYGTKKEKGTGIGLPLCKRIADKISYELNYTVTQDQKNCFILSKKLS
ncbi:HAMP domain-containing sensor histidine kinase [Algoriphagus sp. NG3]|uniref:sensor histidine kinase n=1 Tax=unclassified Algoriphagus TaxID=2641541 RepID=UPI002A7FFEAF|nr:HAMP domain-containing sensor histidine kinase [Algoriphagus sp. NG3]WPR76287.1 HAMP domain-containing sensor histidine kinase [Algoriphagus sp. NG3]